MDIGGDGDAERFAEVDFGDAEVEEFFCYFSDAIRIDRAGVGAADDAGDVSTHGEVGGVSEFDGGFEAVD